MPELSLIDKYRITFMESPFGKEVLSDILFQCHFGESLKDETMTIEYNVGLAILARCGIFGPNTRQDVINALCSVRPKEDED
jgi:hypothetical protein